MEVMKMMWVISNCKPVATVLNFTNSALLVNVVLCLRKYTDGILLSFVLVHNNFWGRIDTVIFMQGNRKLKRIYVLNHWKRCLAVLNLYLSFLLAIALGFRSPLQIYTTAVVLGLPASVQYSWELVRKYTFLGPTPDY